MEAKSEREKVRSEIKSWYDLAIEEEKEEEKRSIENREKNANKRPVEKVEKCESEKSENGKENFADKGPRKKCEDKLEKKRDLEKKDNFRDNGPEGKGEEVDEKREKFTNERPEKKEDDREIFEEKKVDTASEREKGRKIDSQMDDRVRRPGREALPVKRRGAKFGGLRAIPTDPAIDPPPYACFNCWQLGHTMAGCRRERIRIFCDNCGRHGVEIVNCLRCKDAYREKCEAEKDEVKFERKQDQVGEGMEKIRNQQDEVEFQEREISEKQKESVEMTIETTVTRRVIVTKPKTDSVTQLIESLRELSPEERETILQLMREEREEK